MLAVLVLVVLAIEITSRIADRNLAAKKKSDPEYKPDADKSTFMDKLSLDALEYGDVHRAVEQNNARNGPHPYLTYAPIANFKSAPGARLQASHNSLGFRGKETTWEKPAGVYRIVTTGGSSVYGQSESNDKAVWSQVLEDDLNASGGGRKFEVVNTGCSGWSTFEMLINLELRGVNLHPDLVIVYEAINDMRCALYKNGGPVTPDNLQFRAPWPIDRPSSLEKALAASRTYLVWRRYMTDYVIERSDLGFYAWKNYNKNEKDLYWDYADGPVPELGFDNYRRNLNNIISVCSTAGAKVLLVTQALPRWHLDAADSRVEQIDSFNRIQNIEREVAAERGVALFECAKIVEAAVDAEIQQKISERTAGHPEVDPKTVEAELKVVPNRRGDLLFFAEVHPNDRGSALIAKTIAEYLLASPLLGK